MRVGVRFDQAHEHELLDHFMRAVWTELLHPDFNRQEVAGAVTKALGPDPARAMRDGELVVSYRATRSRTWSVG